MAITIMDGGMGGEIRHRLPAATQGLWSAQALIDDPDVVQQVHQDYIDAGARLIITNSYSTIPSYLSKAGLQDRFEELTSLAGRLARRAAAESGQEVVVAGSLPPLEESYRPDLVPDAATALPIYRRLVEALNDSVDMFICETMSSGQEALNAATAASSLGEGKPVFVSWTLDESPGAGLRSGESVEEAFDLLRELSIDGYLFNCTQPEAIEAALLTLATMTDKPVGGYANRLERVPVGWTLDNNITNTLREDLDEACFVACCQRLINAGATMVGGCCGIGPSHIRALSEAMSR